LRGDGVDCTIVAVEDVMRVDWTKKRCAC
jgi:hypothetical protein